MARTSGMTRAEPAIAGRPPAKLALVVNEGSGASDPFPVAERLRAFGAEVEVFGIDAAGQAAAAGADRVVVAGGDGSVAPVAAAAGRGELPLAVIPTGTANDFAHRLGLSLEPAAACRLAALGTLTRTVELGWMEAPAGGHGHPFVNVASAGLPAPAARAAARWKRPLGSLGYALGALAAGAGAHPLGCQVECEGRKLFSGDAWQVSVAASGAFGGGSWIEEADPGDGALDVVVVEAGSRAGLVPLARRLRRGSVSGHRRARHATCTHALVALPVGSEWNVDGELVPFGSARFRGERAAFELLVG